MLDGPPVAAPPVFAPPPTAEPSTDERGRTSSRRSSAGSSDDAVGRQTRVVTGYGSATTGPFDARIEERYDGLVGVSDENPGRAWASARTRYAIAWPEAAVTTEAHLGFRSTSTLVPRRRRGHRLGGRRPTASATSSDASSGTIPRRLQ